MRTNSRVSRSTYQIRTCESISRVEPKRLFRRRAPAATPRSRPEVRPRKLTTRSASPSGNVFRMMASVSRAGMGSRRADAAPDNCETPSESHAHAELNYLPHASARRNLSLPQKHENHLRQVEKSRNTLSFEHNTPSNLRAHQSPSRGQPP